MLLMLLMLPMLLMLLMLLMMWIGADIDVGIGAVLMMLVQVQAHGQVWMRVPVRVLHADDSGWLSRYRL